MPHVLAGQDWTQASWRKARTGVSVQGPVMEILTPLSYLLLQQGHASSHGYQPVSPDPTPMDPTSLLSLTHVRQQPTPLGTTTNQVCRLCMCVCTRVCSCVYVCQCIK